MAFPFCHRICLTLTLRGKKSLKESHLAEILSTNKDKFSRINFWLPFLDLDVVGEGEDRPGHKEEGEEEGGLGLQKEWS